jgi:hypothetical protein
LSLRAATFTTHLLSTDVPCTLADPAEKRARVEEQPNDDNDDATSEDNAVEEESDEDFCYNSQDGSGPVLKRAHNNVQRVLTTRMGMSETDAKVFMRRHIDISITHLIMEEFDDVANLGMSVTFSGIRSAQTATEEPAAPTKKKAKTSKQPSKHVPPATLTASSSNSKKWGWSSGYVVHSLHYAVDGGADQLLVHGSAQSEGVRERFEKQFKLSKPALEKIRQAVFGQGWSARTVLEVIYAASAGVDYWSHEGDKMMDSELKLSCNGGCAFESIWLAFQTRKAAGCPLAKDKKFQA